MSRDATTTIDPDEIDALLAAADPLPARRARRAAACATRRTTCAGALLAQPRAAGRSSPARRPQRSRLAPPAAARAGGRRRVRRSRWRALSLGKPGEKAGHGLGRRARPPRRGVAARPAARRRDGMSPTPTSSPRRRASCSSAFGATPGSKRRRPSPPTSGREAALNWRGGDAHLVEEGPCGVGEDQRDGTGARHDRPRLPVRSGADPAGRTSRRCGARTTGCSSSAPGSRTWRRSRPCSRSSKQVDTDTWLSALPASVIKAAGPRRCGRRDAARHPAAAGLRSEHHQGRDARRRIATNSEPPFREPSRARGLGAGRTRAAVATRPACARRSPRWPRQRTGRSSRRWRVPGDYPEVMWQLVEAMPSGRWYGRPLAGDVDPALGCTRLGISLG